MQGPAREAVTSERFIAQAGHPVLTHYLRVERKVA